MEFEEALEAVDNGTSTKLVMTFQKADGTEFDISFNYANTSATGRNIKNLMEGIITNGTIYDKVPATIVEAKFVTTTTQDIDLSE